MGEGVFTVQAQCSYWHKRQHVAVCSCFGLLGKQLREASDLLQASQRDASGLRGEGSRSRCVLACTYTSRLTIVCILHVAFIYIYIHNLYIVFKQKPALISVMCKGKRSGKHSTVHNSKVIESRIKCGASRSCSLHHP